MKEENCQAANANVMLPHPCDANHALLITWGYPGDFELELQNERYTYYEAVRAMRAMKGYVENKDLSIHSIRIVQIQKHVRHEKVPQWVDKDPYKD